MRSSKKRNIEYMDGFVPALDGVRGYAILMVLSIHAIQYSKVSGYEYDPFKTLLHKITSFGWLGVDLFFVLSGFLITGILLKTKSNNNYLKNFYAKRTLRIFPLYFLFITIIMFLVPIFIDYFNKDYYASFPFGKYIFYVYLQNFFAQGGNTLPHMLLDPMWSLAVEEHFYLMWPFVVLLLSNKKLIWFCVVSILSVVCLRYYLHDVLRVLGDWLVRWTFTRIDSIMIGALLAVMIRDKVVSACLDKYKYAIMGLLSLGAGGSLLLSDHFRGIYGFTVFALFFGSVINVIMFSYLNSMVSSLFDSRFIRIFGKHSYAIYVIHMPVICVVYSYILGHNYKTMYFGSIIMFLLTCAISLLLSIIIWHSYEKHFLSLKEKFNS